MTSTIIRPVAEDRSGADPAKLTYRPALDGLRAVAVLAVIAYHLDAPWLPGGFLGVDLFFVLSGMLITALLMLELETRGSVDRWRFWARRMRRLLPAVLLLLVVVVPLARADIGIRGDALATLGYVANWRFAELARSYFADTAAMSPLNHMWSLAIEEQFYIVWPLIIGVLGTRRRLAVVAMGLMVVLSAILMAQLYAPSDPSQAYYHTFARAHELVVGALVAVPLIGASPLAARIRRIAGRLLPLAAIAVGLAFFVVSDTAAPYYQGVSLAFSVAAGILLLGLEDGGRRLGRVLAWEPLVRIGALSYGLYLWHWPLIVLAKRAGYEGPVLWGGVVVVTFAAAYLSARFVEQPIRRGRLPRQFLTPHRTVGLGAAAIVVAAVAVVLATPVTLQPAWTQATAGRAPTVVTADPSDAASAPTSPGPGTPVGLPPGVELPDTPGEAGRQELVIGVVGDSAAASMVPGLARAAEVRGHTLVSVAARGCPIVDVLQVDDDNEPLRYSAECLGHVRTAFDQLISAHDPDIVVWYSGRDTQTRLRIDDTVVAPGDPVHTEAVADGFDEAVEELTAGGAELVIVRSLPRDGNVVGDCSRPLAPGTDWCDDIDRVAGPPGQNKLYEELVDRYPQAHLISVADVVCGRDRVCDDTLADGVTWRTDLTHFGEEGARRVGEAIMWRALVATALD